MSILSIINTSSLGVLTVLTVIWYIVKLLFFCCTPPPKNTPAHIPQKEITCITLYIVLSINKSVHFFIINFIELMIKSIFQNFFVNYKMAGWLWPFLDSIDLLEKKSSVLNILYTGKIFAPVLFSPLSPLFSGGEYKTWQIPMSQIINL